MLLQAAGATLLGIAGGLVLWSGDAVGERFGGGLRPELGIDRLSGVFLLMLGIASGPVLVFAAGYLDASGSGSSGRCAHWGLRGGPRADAVRARRAHVPARLGAHDAHPRRDHPRLAQRGARAPRRLRLRRDHAPGRRRGVGRAARPGRARRARRAGARRLLVQRRARGGRRADRLRRQGGRDAAARLAAAGAPARSGARLGAHERRDDQGRALRAHARARRVARPAAAVARRHGRRRSARHRRWAASSTPSSSTSSSACSRCTRSRTSASSCSDSAPRWCCASAASPPGRPSRSPRRCCTRSTTPSSRRCSSSAPARSSAPSATSSSTGWAVCCAACRGPARPSWSVLEPSPASRR